MPEALEWFQCKKCGRRQRWTAEHAGREVPCRCGTMITCPKGVDLSDSVAGRSASFSDTLVEHADMESAADPAEALAPEYFTIQEQTARPRTAEELRATKSFYIWTGGMLFGLAMLIHAVVTQWDVYIYTACVVVPITFWKFFKAKRRWQHGRSFSESLARSLGMD